MHLARMKIGNTTVLLALLLGAGADSAGAAEPDYPYVPGFNEPAELSRYLPARLQAWERQSGGGQLPPPAPTPRASPLSEPAPEPGGFSFCFTAELGFAGLRPQFAGNPAFAVQSANSAGGTSSRQQDFQWSAESAPSFALGFTTNLGLGARLRTWGFDHRVAQGIINTNGQTTTINSANPLLPGIRSTTTGDLLVARSRLRLFVLDLEVTEELKHGWCSFLYSGGLRYAHVAQNYDVDLLNLNSGNADALLFGHNFNGAGTTAAAECLWHVFHTGWSLYGTARGSILFGDAKGHAFRGSNDAAVVHETLLPIVELEAGVECVKNLGAVCLFLRLGLIDQVWFGIGNASSNDAITTSSFPQQTSNGQGNLGLVGGVFRFGIFF